MEGLLSVGMLVELRRPFALSVGREDGVAERELVGVGRNEDEESGLDSVGFGVSGSGDRVLRIGKAGEGISGGGWEGLRRFARGVVGPACDMMPRAASILCQQKIALYLVLHAFLEALQTAAAQSSMRTDACKRSNKGRLGYNATTFLASKKLND